MAGEVLKVRSCGGCRSRRCGGALQVWGFEEVRHTDGDTGRGWGEHRGGVHK